MHHGFFLAFHNHPSHMEDLLMMPRCAITPFAVEVCSGDVCTVVAVYDAIGIQHWDNLEDECLAQPSCNQ